MNYSSGSIHYSTLFMSNSKNKIIIKLSTCFENNYHHLIITVKCFTESIVVDKIEIS